MKLDEHDPTALEATLPQDLITEHEPKWMWLTIQYPTYAHTLTTHRSIPLGMKNHNTIQDRQDSAFHHLTRSYNSRGKRVKLKRAWLAFLLIGIYPRLGGTSEK